MGRRIRRARERKRWTQQQLADALGVSVRTVNDWENDRSYPRSSVGALEDVLGVSLDEPAPGPPVLPPLIAANQHDDAVMRIWGMTDEPEAVRLGMIRYMLDQRRDAG